MRVTSEESRWLRVQQAADTLGVSATTVRRWADSGRLMSRRTPSGQRRFLLDDLMTTAIGSVRDAEPDARSDGADQRYQLLLDTSIELASTLDLGEILELAARRLSAALAIPDCDIYRVEGDGRLTCLASTLDGVHDTSWVGHELDLDDWPSERLAILLRRAVAVERLDHPALNETVRSHMRHYGQRSFIALPLVARDKVIGVVDLLDHVERVFTQDETATAEAVGQLVALALEHAQLYEEVKRLHLGNLRALSSALSAKDYYTLGHAGRVAAYMALLGSELDWPEDRLEDVRNVAFLHDIGKIGVSDRVLLKAGPLTSEEWELMRQHPGISAEIVRPLFDEELVAGVRHHHERLDGKGYPDGLAGEAIPLIARAMCVVDCYDAMSCERPYRRALSYRQCLAELRRCAGTQFDPDMVVAFERALKRLSGRRASVDALAAQAAALIDPAAHSLLRSRSDEESIEYKTMVAGLRTFRDDHPPLRFITTFAITGDRCVTVLDTGDTESDVSHLGDQWLAQDELAAVLAGERPRANVLNADDFGVWVTGTAPIVSDDGKIVAAVTVDAPALQSLEERLQADRSHTLAAMLQAAAIRFSRAEVEAITDGLTGLYNHRYLHERLEEELERARRRETTLSLLFFDCDEFKVYNDAYGHKAGDAALARIARITEASSRRVDLAARYGGEEFVLVLVETDGRGALTVAERIRGEVASSSVLAGRPLSVSIGVATYPNDASAKDELLDKADWAMYAAKRAGRNRVLAFSDGLVSQETWLSRRGR
jgi:diguanylate cyclase (GGDEF)-like protein/excisionase family DNA binding protein